MTNQYKDTARVIGMVIVAVIFLVVMMILSGCNTYHIKRCENGTCAEAEISSMRKFKHIEFEYNRETGAFRLVAGEVGTDISAITTLANVIMLQQQAAQEE